jgi:hypothetical protein
MKWASGPKSGPGGGGTKGLSGLKNGSGPKPPWSRARARASSRHTSSSMNRRSTSLLMICSRRAAASHSTCGGGGSGGPPWKCPGTAAPERRLSVRGVRWREWSSVCRCLPRGVKRRSRGRGSPEKRQRGSPSPERKRNSMAGEAAGFGGSLRLFERRTTLMHGAVPVLAAAGARRRAGWPLL